MIADHGTDRHSAQAARVALYLKSEQVYFRDLRNQRRLEWCDYHEALERSHRALAEAHRQARMKLLSELEGQVNGNGKA